MVTVAVGFPLVLFSKVITRVPCSSVKAHLDFRKLSLLNKNLCPVPNSKIPLGPNNVFTITELLANRKTA